MGEYTTRPQYRGKERRKDRERHRLWPSWWRIQGKKNKGKKDRSSPSYILRRNGDTLHRLQRSPRAIPHLPIHAPTNNTPRRAVTAPAKLNKMSKRALDPSRAELGHAPRELDDRAQRRTARFRRRIDQRSPQRSEQLLVREDERLSLRVAVGQVRERERSLERDVRVARFEGTREGAQEPRRAERLEHRVDVVLAVGKVAQQVERLLAHARVRVIEALVERGPADVRHDRALCLQRAFVHQVFERPQRAEA